MPSQAPGKSPLLAGVCFTTRISGSTAATSSSIQRSDVESFFSFPPSLAVIVDFRYCFRQPRRRQSVCRV